MEGVELDGRFYLGFTALIMLKGEKKEERSLILDGYRISVFIAFLICSKEETVVDLMSLLISSELII